MNMRSTTHHNSLRRTAAWCAAIVLALVFNVAASRAAPAQPLILPSAPPAETPQPPQQADPPADDEAAARPTLHVTDWLVQFMPANKDELTRALTIRSTLPATFPGNRTQPRNVPNIAQPIGLITFRSEAEPPRDEFEVRIGNAACAFRAAWPGTAYTVAPVSWAKLKIVPGDAKLATLPDKHWLHDMRDDGAIAVQYGTTTDRMLLYDVDITQRNPIDLTVSEAQGLATLKVTATDANVRAVLVIVPVDDRWRVYEIAGEGDVAPFGRGDGDLAHDEAVAKLRAFVRGSDLPDAEVEKVTRVLRDVAMWKHQPTVISRINDKGMDVIMPLSIRGVDARQTRAGFLVTVINRFVPTSDVNALVKQLGDDRWRVREDAEKQLIQIGHAAGKAVDAAAANDDLEIRHRAARIQSQLSDEQWLPYPPAETPPAK
jgi:hypothetical protein